MIGQNALLDELDIHADELSCMDLEHEDSDQHPGVFGDDLEEVTVVANRPQTKRISMNGKKGYTFAGGRTANSLQ